MKYNEVNCFAILMFKLAIDRKFPFLKILNERHRLEVYGLRHEIEELRERLIAAQEAKIQALKQTDDIRREKERLRARVSDHKQENDALAKVNDRLQAKVLSLQSEIELLRPMTNAIGAKSKSSPD